MKKESPFATRIIGTGSAFPATRVTNGDLVAQLAAQGVVTSDEWILKRTGIKERRISKMDDPAEQNSGLASTASARALEMAGLAAADLDFILYATSTPDTPLPSSACHLQAKLGAKNAWALDVNAACSGFVYALSIADQFIRSGCAKQGLVVGADVLQTITNWKDRGSCILFGDGAGAVVVAQTPAQSKSRILSSHLRAAGELGSLLHIPVGGSNTPYTKEADENGDTKMVMNGREVYKIAVITLTDLAQEALRTHEMSAADLDWFLPHQANLRIIEAVADRLEFPMEKVLLNIDRYGNTSSATVPTALDEAVRAGKIHSGQTILMDVFGAGVTSGSLLLRW